LIRKTSEYKDLEDIHFPGVRKEVLAGLRQGSIFISLQGSKIAKWEKWCCSANDENERITPRTCKDFCTEKMNVASAKLKPLKSETTRRLKCRAT
jgi:hypothetical protein